MGGKTAGGSERPLAGEAREFALRAHGGQKYGDQPYAVHLDDVARTVAELGFTSPVHQVVAYLHDVLEDTATSPSELERRFGREVREAVEELTRRGDDPEYYARMGALALAVKLADRLSNIRNLGHSGAADPKRLARKYRGDQITLWRACYARGSPYLEAMDILGTEMVKATLRVDPIEDPAQYLSGFFVVGERPVMVQPTGDGGIEVLAYDWATGEFVRDASYLARVTFLHGEVDSVTREEFEAIVADIRARRGV